MSNGSHESRYSHREGQRADGKVGDGRHETALLRLADQVVHKLADRRPSETAGIQGEAIATPLMVDALLDRDDDRARDLVFTTHRRDMSLRPAYFRSLAPALHRLGEMWENDDVSFMQVSMAAGRILSIMRYLRRELPIRHATERPGHLALFANDPGEGHVIGVTMAADLFREQGWDIDVCTWAGTAQLIETAQQASYPVVALSVGRPIDPAPLAHLIAALRQVTPGVRILISGPIVTVMPGIAAQVGADAAENDFDRALACCEAFVTAS